MQGGVDEYSDEEWSCEVTANRDIRLMERELDWVGIIGL